MPLSFKDNLWHIFDQAVEMQGAERQAFLDTACGEDQQLRGEVDDLLKHADADEVARAHSDHDFLLSPVIRDESPHEPRTIPQQIGSYRILSLLGSGAMGTVYEAEQAQPRREVALKVLRTSGLHTHKIHRFLKEVYILGQLRHAGIAQIYEAGVDDQQQPYFAMELVRGLPLDKYVSTHLLTVSQRLQLLIQILEAVEHAHRRGVIHRDLKPGNILVDAQGCPKVLDFGVARITGQEAAWSTSVTETGQWLGTLAYMSPEQISFKPSEIDGRSDVYALGLLMYEVLSNRRPYELSDVSLPEVARIIREVEPPLLGTIDGCFSGDIETIVAKAIEKDRNRRYASPAEMRDDIERYLRHETIVARPPSSLYRLRKFSRRNWQLLTIIATLMIGLVGTAWFAALAEQAARLAKRDRAAALAEAYTARLYAAGNALDDYNVSAAQAQLAAAPESMRGWEWFHLSSRTGNHFAKVEGAPDSKSNVVYGADEMLVYQANASELIIRNANGELVKRVEFPWSADIVFPVAMRGDELRACVNTQGRLRVIDGNARVLLDTNLAKPYLGRAAMFSHDLKTLALAYIDGGTIMLFDLESGQEVRACGGTLARVYGLSFDRQDKRLASSGEDNLARVWDVDTAREQAVMRGHAGNVWSVAWHPDGTRIVTGSADGTVRQWDAQSGQPIGYPFLNHEGDVMAVSYSPDGQSIASTAHDRTVRIWDAESRRELSVLFGHDFNMTMLNFSADGKHIGAGGYQRNFYVWNTPQAKDSPLVLRAHDKSVYPAEVSRDGRWVVSGGWDAQVHAWESCSGRLQRSLPPNDQAIRSLAITSDNSAITTALRPPYFRRWNLRDGSLTFEKMQEPLSQPPHTLSLSPDDNYLASSGMAGLQVWDRTSGALVATLCSEDTYSHKHAFSPDGKWFAGPGPALAKTSLWSFDESRADKFKHHADLISDELVVTPVVFSPDSRYLVTSGRNRVLSVWNVATGKLERRLAGHTDEVFAIAFHPDMSRLASGGRDRVVRIWDWASGKEIANLTGHTNYIWSLAFTPDGQTLVSGSGDTTVRQWSTRSIQDFYQAQRRE